MKGLTPKQVAALLAKVERLKRERDEARAAGKKRRTNVNGGSKDVNRGAWCTPLEWAQRVGPVDLDPLSNPRSHIQAAESCQLERGENGLFGLPGSRECIVDGRYEVKYAGADARVWLQPPYELVLETIAHYGHTRFTALLRFDPSTEWFRRLYRLTSLVCVPRTRIDFEPPPGVKASSNPFPHALFYRDPTDATPEVLRACIAWRTR